MIHQFRGILGRGSQSRCGFKDLRSSEHNRTAILAKSNMAPIQLDVNLTSDH